MSVRYPKRKLVTGTEQDEVIMNAVDYAVENAISELGTLPLIVKRLTVTHRLKIPIGTDMYD